MSDLDYSLSVDALPAEPWVPKVGDRVRVRLSGECRFPEIADGSHATTVMCGPFDDDGKTGIFMHIAAWGKAREYEHPYLVKWDDCVYGGGWYALSELEPVT